MKERDTYPPLLLETSSPHIGAHLPEDMSCAAVPLLAHEAAAARSGTKVGARPRSVVAASAASAVDPIEHHWITSMLRHDARLNASEVAPTGDDYNAVLPSKLGLIWHTCEDECELTEHIVQVTRRGGAVIQVVEEGQVGFRVVFAITHADYAALIGRTPDAEEWLDISPD